MRPISAPPWSKWGRAPPRSRPIPAGASCMPADLRSAGNTSPWILRAAFRACIADAERIKTLYGTVLTGGSDARELMSVPAAGDNERDAPQIVSRATIANIVRHRAEEIFEMVRDRLADSPFAAEPRARVVLSGGASQLTGIPELATADPRPAGAHRPSARLRPACPTKRRARRSRCPRVSWSIRNTLILNMSNRGIRGSSGQGLTAISERSDDGFARASDESFPHLSNSPTPAAAGRGEPTRAS